MHQPPQGRLTLTIRTRHGALVGERRARNLVVRDGAALIAALFSGQTATHVDNIRIGFGDHATAESKALTVPGGPFDFSLLQAPVKPEHFQIDAGGAGAVKVSISVPFEPKEDLGNVSEAGLFAGGTLYNQVVFEPIAMTKGQAITFFWQIDFPFGR
jgi:hypothetical protein